MERERNEGMSRRRAAVAGLSLWALVGCASAGAESGIERGGTLGQFLQEAQERVEERAAHPLIPEGWERLSAERREASKRLTIRAESGGEVATLFIRGEPVRRDSWLNLLVDEDLYERRIHRVRYRFDHPVSGERIRIDARARSHRVGSVPVKSRDGEMTLEVYAGRGRNRRVIGALEVSDRSPVLFSGDLGGRRVEIERLDPALLDELESLRHVRTPLSMRGEYAVRFDGEEVARFFQDMPRAGRVPYALGLAPGVESELRGDALLAFCLFDAMKDFIASR